MGSVGSVSSVSVSKNPFSPSFLRHLLMPPCARATFSDRDLGQSIAGFLIFFQESLMLIIHRNILGPLGTLVFVIRQVRGPDYVSSHHVKVVSPVGR